VTAGVRYYKDGSGEPDSYDFIEVLDAVSIHDAARKGISHALIILLRQSYEAYAENLMYKEMDEKQS
jgi:hypothetical protein